MTTPSKPRSPSRTKTAARPVEQRRAFQPVKPREYGTPEEVVSRGVDQAGGAKAVGHFFGVSVQMVHRWTDPDGPSQLSFGRALRMTEFMDATVFAETFASAAGGVFVPGPDGCPAESLTKLTLKSNEEMATLLSAAFDAYQDGKVTVEEARILDADLEEVLHTLLLARARLKAILNGDA